MAGWLEKPNSALGVRPSTGASRTAAKLCMRATHVTITSGSPFRQTRRSRGRPRDQGITQEGNYIQVRCCCRGLSYKGVRIRWREPYDSKVMHSSYAVPSTGARRAAHVIRCHFANVLLQRRMLTRRRGTIRLPRIAKAAKSCEELARAGRAPWSNATDKPAS